MSYISAVASCLTPHVPLDLPPPLYPHLEDVVDLGDELHVAVLDAVVDHLDVVARPDGPAVRRARLAPHLSSAPTPSTDTHTPSTETKRLGKS